MVSYGRHRHRNKPGCKRTGRLAPRQREATLENLVSFPRSRICCVLLYCSLLGFGCSEAPPTQVVVLVDTDYAVPAEIDRIRAQVAKVVPTPTGAAEMQTWDHVFAVTRGATSAPGVHALPATFGILPEAGDLDREIVIRLEALAPGSEAPLVTRRVRTGFVPGEARLVRMLLHEACAGTRCPAGEVCGCPDAIACATPSCVDEYLAPERLEPMQDPGALPVNSEFPTPVDLPDASVPDAAVPDAAVPDAAVPDASVPDASVPDGGVLECEAPLELCDDECVDPVDQRAVRWFGQEGEAGRRAGLGLIGPVRSRLRVPAEGLQERVLPVRSADERVAYAD